MFAKVYVTFKAGVLDPQGQAVQSALATLGHHGVRDVRQGKYFEVQMAGQDVARTREELAKMCEELLANTVIEDYRIEVDCLP